LRENDDVPTIGEISLHLLVWSLLFEVAGPHIFRWAIGDPWDVAAYVVGGIVAGLWWRRTRLYAFLT
jgi:hypothetical protein